MNEIKINNSNGTLTVSSLQIAYDFGKQHKHVLETIENIKAENSAVTPMFIESAYTAGTGKAYKCYDITRDGFSLLVMGFTGKKALEWKIKYIEAFNAMEERLKSKLDYSGLSPQLQFLIQLEKRQNKLEKQIDSMCETMQVRGSNWRKATHSLINRIASASGIEQRELYIVIYDELECRAGVNLDRRLTNLQDRLYDRGVSESRISRLNYIDVIAEDRKLIEIYIAIVKETAIKYNAE